MLFLYFFSITSCYLVNSDHWKYCLMLWCIYIYNIFFLSILHFYLSTRNQVHKMFCPIRIFYIMKTLTRIYDFDFKISLWCFTSLYLLIIIHESSFYIYHSYKIRYFFFNRINAKRWMQQQLITTYYECNATNWVTKEGVIKWQSSFHYLFMFEPANTSEYY